MQVGMLSILRESATLMRSVRKPWRSFRLERQGVGKRLEVGDCGGCLSRGHPIGRPRCWMQDGPIGIGD